MMKTRILGMGREALGEVGSGDLCTVARETRYHRPRQKSQVLRPLSLCETRNLPLVRALPLHQSLRNRELPLPGKKHRNRKMRRNLSLSFGPSETVYPQVRRSRHRLRMLTNVHQPEHGLDKRERSLLGKFRYSSHSLLLSCSCLISSLFVGHLLHDYTDNNILYSCPHG